MLEACKSKPKQRKDKGKERSWEEVKQPAQSTSVWMGMDTPFKSMNAWFVEPGKSNRSKQPGMTKPPSVETNILVGIATPLVPGTSNIRQWGEREEPPHLPSNESRRGTRRDSGKPTSQTQPSEHSASQNSEPQQQ